MKQLMIYSRLKVWYTGWCTPLFPLFEKELLFWLLTSPRSMCEHNLSCQSSEPISCRSCSCSHINTQHSGCWRAERGKKKKHGLRVWDGISFDAPLFTLRSGCFLKIACFLVFYAWASSTAGSFTVSNTLHYSGFVMMQKQTGRCILQQTKAK